MNIGDLFMRVVADTTGFQADLVKKTEKAGDAAGASLGARIAAGIKKSWSGGEIGKGLVQGLGLAGGLGAAQLFSTAMAKVGDVISDANAAALEEESSIHLLDTALRANIKGWDGNTDAIERVIKARMALGFSDDEQRTGLAHLVAATHDVNKALEIQRVAMDLARFKGISLAEATDALTKVEAGSFRILKSLGIQLPKNAKAQDALNAVEKVAAGQAADYAQTNAGKLLVSQVKMNEALEKLGLVTLPIMVAATQTAADAVTSLAGGFQMLTGQVPLTDDAIKSLTKTLSGLLGPLGGPAIGILQGFQDKLNEVLGIKGRGTVDTFAGKVQDDAVIVTDAFQGIEDASGTLQQESAKDYKSIAERFHEMTDKIVADAKAAVSDAFDPMITKQDAMANLAELASARAILASSKSTAAEKKDAHDKLLSLEKDNADYLVDLAAAGQTGTKAYQDGMKELDKNIAAASGNAKAALIEVRRQIRLTAQLATAQGILGMVQATQNVRERASGGPVDPFTPYLVNENTPRSEIFVPQVPGRIVTQAQAAAAAAGGGPGGGNAYIVNVAGLVRARQATDIGDNLRRLSEFGVLGPRPLED